MRKIKIMNVDMYGFNGRDNHPELRHNGMTGIVLNSYWEKFNCDAAPVESTGEGVSKQDLLYFGECLVKDTDDEQNHYEVMTVYLPETKEIVCILSFESRDL